MAARTLLTLRETLFIRVQRLGDARATCGCGFGRATVRRGFRPRGAGRTLGAIGVCNAGAHSVGPLALLTCRVSNAHLVLKFFRFSTRGGGSETARATLSALGVCFGVTLGLGPFTLLACGVNDAHTGLLFTFVIAGGFLGAEPAFAACYTHRVGVVGPRTFRPFTGVTQFMAYREV